MMHSNFNTSWFCGPGSFFSGLHFGGVIPFILWGLLLYFIYRIIHSLLIRNSLDSNDQSSVSRSFTILSERYASGEIGQEEFLRKKKDIGS